MDLNWIGLIAAFSTFLGIWLGHVAVRKIEAKVERLWIPVAGTLILGLILEICSLLVPYRMLSAATGILGITVLWDCFEFWRQQKRVIKGHAPANPSNSRHARILAETPAATTMDLLKRDPTGHPLSADEAVQLTAIHQPPTTNQS